MGEPATRDGASLKRDAPLLVMGAVAFAFAVGLTTLRQPYLAAVVAGAALGSSLSGSVLRRAALSASAVLAGALSAVWLFDPQRWQWLVARQPAFMVLNVPPDFVERFLAPLQRGGVFARSYGGPGGRLLFVVLAVLVASVAAAGVAALVRRFPGPLTRVAVASAVLALLTVAFGWTLLRADASFVQQLRSSPKDGYYYYDALIYERASWLMRSGDGYYPALVRAGAGDQRLRQWNAVANGRFQGWVMSPVQIRQPLAFYVWRLAGSAVRVLGLSALLSVACLFACYFALRRFIGERALLVAVFSFPILLMQISSHTIFFPDFWAGLAVLLGVFAVIGGRWSLSGVLGLVAALFRETAALWLLVLVVVAVVYALRTRERRWVVRSAVFACLLGAFAVAFAVHVHLASAFVSPLAAPPAAVATLLGGWRLNSLAVRFAAPGSYMAFPYGFGLVPPFLMMFAQLPGLWHALRPDPARIAVFGYALAWLLFALVVGTTSTYWGLEFVPLAVVGTGLAMACADGIAADAASIVRRRARIQPADRIAEQAEGAA